MLIRPHNSSRDLNAPAEKTTITRFNEQRAAKPDFYKIKAGDVFATWPTIKAFQGGTSNGGELPTYYEWNGSKLIKTTKGHFRTRSPWWCKCRRCRHSIG